MTSVEKKPGGVPLPPLIYVAAIALSPIAHSLYPLPWISSPLADILFAAGWLTLLAFAGLLYSAITTMRRAKTTLNPNATPDHLVTGGPFSISRNPMYLANTLLMVGVGLIAGIAWFLIFAVLAAFTTQKVSIEGEEKKLSTKFGKRYHDYAKRVRRWI